MHEGPYKASESASPTSTIFLRSSEHRPFYGSRVVLVQRVRAPTTVEGGLPESVSDLKSTSTSSFCLRALVVRWLVQTERSKCESPGKHSVWAGKAHAAPTQLLEPSCVGTTDPPVSAHPVCARTVSLCKPSPCQPAHSATVLRPLGNTPRLSLIRGDWELRPGST